MALRQVVVKESAAESISSTAYFIESKVMLATAEKFVDDIYDCFLKLSDNRRSYAICREPSRASLGYKCLTYRKSTQSFLLKILMN